MTHLQRDPATGMPLFVEAAPWMRLLEAYRRPAGIPVPTWWTWTTGRKTPALVNLADILATIGIPEAAAIAALGWSQVPLQMTKVEKDNQRAELRHHDADPARLPDRTLSIADVVSWSQRTRVDLYREATLKREKARIETLPVAEQAKAYAELQARTKNTYDQKRTLKERRELMRAHEAVGLPVPKKPDGSYDVKAFFKNVSRTSQPLQYIPDPADADIPESPLS